MSSVQSNSASTLTSYGAQRDDKYSVINSVGDNAYEGNNIMLAVGQIKLMCN